jgi:hypothetical protein
MKPYSSEIPANRTDILRSKYLYGMWFGMVMGLTFSIFAWGVDAYRLNQINGLYPWLKFLVGMSSCVIVGGFTGWLSARIGKAVMALLLWALAALVFAWLTVSLPLQIMPRVLSIIEPALKDLLHYTYYEQFLFRFGVAYVWLAIFVSLAGLLQIPLSDSAIFSTSILGKVSPMLIVLVLMALSGNTMDNLNNESLRSPIEALNSTTQFFIDHRGEDIDPLESRQMHLASFRTVNDLVTPQRKYVISGYDEFLGNVQVLARFQKAWVECQVIYNQPVSCKQVGNMP